MANKPVQLRNGQKFQKSDDAKHYFQQILNSGDIRIYLVGEERSSIDSLFRDYCEASNWKMPGEPMEYFRNWNRAPGRTTKSFYVKYDTGAIDDFSYIKAIAAVSNWRR